MTNELPGIHKRWIVTAHTKDGGPIRYMSDNEQDARQTEWHYTDMGFISISVRSVLWDNRKGVIV